MLQSKDTDRANWYKKKSWLIWKDSDAGKDWGQEKKGTKEDEMVGWHHWLNGHESEQIQGGSEGRGSLACCSSWGRKELSHLKRPWCWERLKAGGGDDRGWDGWMASLTQWTRVWVSSGSWWWIGNPGVLQSMGSQKVGHDWETELNWWVCTHKKGT